MATASNPRYTGGKPPGNQLPSPLCKGELEGVVDKYKQDFLDNPVKKDLFNDLAGREFLEFACIFQINHLSIRSLSSDKCFITPIIRCYSIVWLGFLRVFSVLSPCHLRVIAGGNTFKRGTNQDEDI